MQDWRAKAIELLPDAPDVEELVTAPSSILFDLWLELYFVLVDCYQEKPPNDVLIGRIYDFASWCLTHPRTEDAETDVSSATAVGFIEPLPLDRQVLGDLHRWVSVETFQGCEGLLSIPSLRRGYRKFSCEFLSKKKLLNVQSRL
jgi:hypothetical protein